MSRSCGSCKACCTAETVLSIGKPMFAPCEHLYNKGCRIYDDRPSECRKYECLWLQGDIASEAMRPDKSGLIFSVINEIDNQPTLVVIESQKGAEEMVGWSAIEKQIPDQYAQLPRLFIKYGLSIPVAANVDKRRYQYPYPATLGLQTSSCWNQWSNGWYTPAEFVVDQQSQRIPLVTVN